MIPSIYTLRAKMTEETSKPVDTTSKNRTSVTILTSQVNLIFCYLVVG